ncbi:hypothetical protein GQ55_2G013400 [Panicum hallii var. hallii]|uniref:NB-ARC domain-containing protein n=1 Tax=Panicum hallii var. hallii TaxID=1504633 RepID=A0A2T7EKC9_9POAL|nr:hypothetical protein GQ55_2G013400 [Panicum hallii var. hallii]
MDEIILAIISEITKRSISYVLCKYSEITGPTIEDKRLQDLQRLLLRTHSIVKEVEGRLITNRAMVHQLNIMRKEMYRGYFTLDSLRSQASDAKDHDVSHSFTLPKFNHAKRRICSSDGTYRNNELQKVIQNLNNIVADAKEFCMFLKNYPPLYRQPYDMHMFIGKCMFGRQMEVDRIMDFLMQEEHLSMTSTGVLPIIGPGYVGKSTLVAHVYNDARVRGHFSQIIVVNGDRIDDKKLSSWKDRCDIIHQNNALGGKKRLLAVIEFPENVDNVAWNNFYLPFVGCLVRGSKIIITSNSDKIKKFGTTQALILNFLPIEAYWYFFKVLTFGSADSNDYPELESIAMAMAREMGGSFIAANFISAILRRNLSVQHWGWCLAAFKENIRRNVSVFGEYPYDLLQKQKHACYQINEDKYMVSDQYHASCLSGENIPAITMYDVVSGNVYCEGAFEVLAWKSHILPYKSYTISCMIQKEQPIKRIHST